MMRRRMGKGGIKERGGAGDWTMMRMMMMMRRSAWEGGEPDRRVPEARVGFVWRVVPDAGRLC
eukprot:3017557-Rhodomonas_salina.1